MLSPFAYFCFQCFCWRFFNPKNLKYCWRLNTHLCFEHEGTALINERKKHSRRKTVVIDLFVSAQLGHSWHRRTWSLIKEFRFRVSFNLPVTWPQCSSNSWQLKYNGNIISYDTQVVCSWSHSPWSQSFLQSNCDVTQNKIITSGQGTGLEQATHHDCSLCLCFTILANINIYQCCK